MYNGSIKKLITNAMIIKIFKSKRERRDDVRTILNSIIDELRRFYVNSK